jgi:diguanylate cyclase (GGDEF)-like protein
MQKPEIPRNEAMRLRALNSLKILDTAPEERFDRLTRIAKHLFNVPIALFSIVDEDRQWFKSSVGLETKETSRDVSFCGHAILGDSTLIIPDTLKDKRFADNPLVTGKPKIRFYAGAPIRLLNSGMIGTLCIIDKEPRTLSKTEQALLKDLAQIVENEITATVLATHDELTQLLNRRGFIDAAQRSLNLCVRQEMTATIAFMDMNGFKTINDRFGHKAGDKALKAFADELLDTCRTSDLCARMGGDEFVALMFNTSTSSAQHTLSRLRERLSNNYTLKSMQIEGDFALGLIRFNEDLHRDIEQLIDEADKAMYEDKHASKKG